MWLSSDFICKARGCWSLFYRITGHLRDCLSALVREILVVSIDCIRPFLGPTGCCRFYPTCSEYARQELRKGPLFGACWRIIIRLAACHPCGHFSHSRTHTRACCHRAPPKSTKNAQCVHQPPLFDEKAKSNRAPGRYDF